MFRPHVIVLDLSMPGANGLAAAQILKEMSPETHLILFSLFVDLFPVEHFESLGFSAIISKSKPDELLLEAQRLMAA